MPIGFAADIRPLFRDSPEIDSVQGYGLDRSSYADVQAQAAEIYEALANGSMMPFSTAGAYTAGNYCADADLVKSGFDGEHTESNHRLMYT